MEEIMTGGVNAAAISLEADRRGKGFAVSWSGGKDSALALYEARRMGLDIRWLFSMVGPEGRSRAHGIPEAMLKAQSELIGVPLVVGTADWETYEAQFKAVLGGLRASGLAGCVFGDIDIEEHRAWCVRVCEELGIEAVHPLWGLSQEEILRRFLRTGFEAVVVAVDLSKLDASWLGKKLDGNAVNGLASAGITPCGELGEYHTYVTNGPIFSRPVSLQDFGIPRVEVRDQHGFLKFNS